MKLTPLIDHRRIQKRVEELGLEISADYAECQNLVLVCILRGSFVFFADLIIFCLESLSEIIREFFNKNYE